MERVKYMVADALTNLRRSPWRSLATVATIGVSFLITGIFLLITLNLSSLLAAWQEQFQVTVFLEDRITPEQLSLLRRRIGNESAVKAVAHLSKEEALAAFKRELRGKESLLEGLGENPIPASLQLKIREGHQTPEALRQLAAYLGRLEGVEDVLYGQEWIDRLAAIVRVLQLIGLAVGLALAIGSLLIISNTIRLGIFARAEEVEIMRLVGATKGSIRGPYLLEGSIQGALGAGLALLLLYGAYRATIWQLRLVPAQIYGMGLGRFLDPAPLAALLGAGILLGAMGSALAVGRLLRT